VHVGRMDSISLLDDVGVVELGKQGLGRGLEDWIYALVITALGGSCSLACDPCRSCSADTRE